MISEIGCNVFSVPCCGSNPVAAMKNKIVMWELLKLIRMAIQRDQVG